LNGAAARANARRARPAGRQVDAAEGEISEGPESHERYRLKHGGEVSGGTRRQEGGNPEGAAKPGEATPGESLPATGCAVGKETLERRAAPRGIAQIGLGQTPKGSESPRGACGIN